MGKVASKARWIKLDEVQGEDSAWLTGEGWLSDGNAGDGRLVEAWVDGIDGKWTAHHVS